MRETARDDAMTRVTTEKLPQKPIEFLDTLVA
jgi:hypothetical protein